MKTISFLFIIVFSIFTNNNIIGQSENHEGHSHKIDFDEKQALNKFGIDNFINEINSSFNSQGFDYKNDLCLKNFFGIPQS